MMFNVSQRDFIAVFALHKNIATPIKTVQPLTGISEGLSARCPRPSSSVIWSPIGSARPRLEKSPSRYPMAKSKTDSPMVHTFELGSGRNALCKESELAILEAKAAKLSNTFRRARPAARLSTLRDPLLNQLDRCSHVPARRVKKPLAAL